MRGRGGRRVRLRRAALFLLGGFNWRWSKGGEESCTELSVLAVGLSGRFMFLLCLRLISGHSYAPRLEVGDNGTSASIMC